MLQKTDANLEQKRIEELISGSDELRRQHELFEEKMQFMQLLIDARKAHSMTQNEVSLKSGLSQQAVSRLEKGKCGTIDTVIRYLHSMGLSLSVKELVKK